VQVQPIIVVHGGYVLKKWYEWLRNLNVRIYQKMGLGESKLHKT
jgi:hypothetical protein